VLTPATGYGVDWAVISGINSFERWHDYFGFGTSGSTFGIITALMTIGNFCGSYFLALQDVYGRRAVNFTGNVIVIVAGLMQGLATNLNVFMAGRFLLGFGSALMSSSQYMAEVAPLHMRGRLVGIFGACFQIGSVVFLAVMYAFQSIETVSINDFHATHVQADLSFRTELVMADSFAVGVPVPNDRLYHHFLVVPGISTLPRPKEQARKGSKRHRKVHDKLRRR